jgi:hypothetical protein
MVLQRLGLDDLPLARLRGPAYNPQPYERLQFTDVDYTETQATPSHSRSTLQPPGALEHPHENNVLLTFGGLFKAFVAKAGQDVRHTSWATLWAVLHHFKYQILLIPLTVALILLLILMSARPALFLGDFTSADSGCTPDGNVELAVGYTTRYRPFNSSGFFSINIRFGNLSFGVAKLVDVIWDVVSCLPPMPKHS